MLERRVMCSQSVRKREGEVETIAAEKRVKVE